MVSITEKLAFELKLKRTNQESRIISKPLECCFHIMQKPTNRTKKKWKVCTILGEYFKKLHVETTRLSSKKLDFGYEKYF